MSIQVVRTQIRFSLEQLTPQNKHHIFEDIAREFTRQKICRNLLPATGPVGAGGDQGRDFETYTTYLDNGITIEDTELFEGASENGNIFFACSIQKNIAPKIKSDIKSIFSQTSEKRPVVYFCVADVAVAKRNELIKWCRDEYDVKLEIFDGQALSEGLSDPDIFWIAIEFLHIPSDIYPKPNNDDEWYIEYKERWIEHDTQPRNFSDFCQIKYGLRKATFNDKLKPDLPAWLDVIKKFLKDGGSYIKRKVQYEICVVALRGQNNLTAYKDTVVAYFKDIEAITSPSELVDAGVLLSYCSSAKLQGQFDIETLYLHETSKRFVNCVDKFFEEVDGINTRCTLLDIKARSCSLQFLNSEEPSTDLDGAFKYWNELIQSVEQAPLFPLDQFSNCLAELTSYIGTDQRFLALTDQLDGLLAKRMGGVIAAEKCRDRAMAFYKNNNIIQAIDHLHRAKISWFSAETLRGTIVTSRFIADCYSQLGLIYAAKYYLLSSSYLAFHSNDDDVRDLISRSLFQAAEIFYESGEWLSFFDIMQVALMTHHHFDHEPLDIVEHESLQRVFFYTTIIRTLSQRFWKPTFDPVTEKFEDWALDEGTREELIKLSDKQPKNSYWLTESIEEIWTKIEENLSGKPFSDIGATRTILWKALGIKWEVAFPNDYETMRVTEEFIAILQVLLADLAKGDLQLLPVNIKINASLSEDKKFNVVEKFGNEQLEWDINIPAFNESSQGVDDDRIMNVISYAVSVLGFCTTLTMDEYQEIIHTAMEKGLSSKTFFARSYPEILESFIPSDMFDEDTRKNLDPVEPTRTFDFHEHENMTWNNTDGTSFTEDEAHLHATNRYSRISKLMTVVWPKILASKEHNDFFQNLHNKGYKDWHLFLIAGNTIANYVANKKIKKGAPENVYTDTIMLIIDGDMNDEIEELDINEISIRDLEVQEKISFVSMMRTWGLSIHTPTPNFKAIRRFMGERYGVFDIDVPHQSLF